MVKERAIKQLEGELNDLMFEETSLVATAYRSTVSTNSFGKKNYSRFKKELIEHLLDNTESEDVMRTLNILKELGIKIFKDEDGWIVYGNGTGGFIEPKKSFTFDFGLGNTVPTCGA